jgi:Ni/Co efflux regulator RcnB
MREWRRWGVILALTCMAASGAPAQEKETRLETARWAADLNAKSQSGREWKARNEQTIGKLVTPVLNGCLPEEGDEITAFSVFLRLSRKGRVLEVLTDLDDPSLGTCMTSSSRELQLPEPPRDDYWVQVNLAASL